MAVDLHGLQSATGHGRTDIVESDQTLCPSCRTADGVMESALPERRPQLLGEEQEQEAAEDG